MTGADRPGAASRLGTGAAGDGPAMGRALAVLLGAAGAVVVVGGMRDLGWLLGPMVLGLVLVIAVMPVQNWLIARRVPGGLASLVVLLILYSVLLGLVVAVGIAVAQLANLLPQYSAEFTRLVDQGTQVLSSLGIDTAQLNNAITSLDLGRVATILGNVLSSLTGLASLLLVLFTSILVMTLDAAGFPQRMLSLRLVRPELTEALSSFARNIRRYLVVSTGFGAANATLNGVALQMIGVPLPWLWAVLSFLTNYIPNIGFVIALVPPALLALLAKGPGLMAAVIVTYLLLNFVVQTVVQPRVMGNELGLSTTLTFASVLFWGWVLGTLGALLAVPMTLLVKAILVDADPRARWVTLMIGGGTASSPEQADVPDREGVGAGNVAQGR